MSLMAFIFFYTIEAGQIIFTVVNFIIWSYVPVVLIYSEELTGLTIVMTLCIAVGLFLIICLLAVSILYVIEL